MRTTSRAGVVATALAVALLTASPALAHDGGRSGEGERYQVTTRSDTVDVEPGDGKCADEARKCSLRAAVQEANASGGGRIELGKGRYTLSLRGAEDAAKSGDLDVTSRVTVSGDGATIDAAGIDRVLDVRSGGSLTLRHLTVTGGVAPREGASDAGSGGGVRNAGTLVVDRSTVTGNSAARAGGGIEAVEESETTLTRATLSKNSTGPTPGNGGGLHLTGAGTVHVDRTTVTGNTAAAEGGGLWNSAAGTMTVERSTVERNTASGPAADQGGGGLFNDGGTLTVVRSEVRHNVADGTDGSGGGILNDGGTLVVERTVVKGNSAVRAGGGIEADAGTTRLERTDLTRNSTGAKPGNGGGLHLTGAGQVRIDRGSVTGNSAAAEGGGLWNSETGTMTVTRTEIRRNTAPVGPDVFQDGNGSGFTVDGRTVPANGS